MITSDAHKCNLILGCPLVSCPAIVFVVTTKKGFLAFRVSPDLKNEIQGIANSEARSISQVCELLLSEGVQAYKKEGPKFMQRLVARQKVMAKDS
jgi:hypothetical protein